MISHWVSVRSNQISPFFSIIGKGSSLLEYSRRYKHTLFKELLASGPAYPDASTSEQAQAIIRRHGIALSSEARQLLSRETPKQLDHVISFITGSVRQLCHAAEAKARQLGYEPFILTDSLCCTARDAGSFLASIARYHQDTKRSVAFLAGGETVVYVAGKGRGGRNQEIALAAAIGINGVQNAAVFSFGSDGTDGPTDAAGGYVDGTTCERMRDAGIDPQVYLENNDSYHALKAVSSLLITGPTGTNVNDLSVVLLRR